MEVWRKDHDKMYASKEIFRVEFYKQLDILFQRRLSMKISNLINSNTTEYKSKLDEVKKKIDDAYRYGDRVEKAIRGLTDLSVEIMQLVKPVKKSKKK